MAKRNNKYNQKVLMYPKNIFDGGGLSNNIGTVTQSAASITGNSLSNAQIADTAALERDILFGGNKIIGATDNNTLMQEYGAWSPFSKVKYDDIRGGSTGGRLMNVVGSVGAGAAAGAAAGMGIGSIPGAVVGGVIGLASSVGGWVSGGAKARRKTNDLNEDIALSNARREASFANAIGNVDRANDLNLLANYSAYGGPLSSDGAEWDNGVVIIGNGGTHENNPMQGVQMGIDQQGVPNLVEEGEVKWNDYIFSNRLKAKEKELENMGLNKRYANKTFADIAKDFNKESEERPNDPISKNGLTAMMSKLANIQEAKRTMMQQKQQGNQFSDGGGLYGTNNVFGYQPFNEYDAINESLIPQKRNVGTLLPRVDNRGILPVGVQTMGVTNPIQRQVPPPKDKMNIDTMMRYAPALGSGIGVLTDTLGLTNKPDYTTANMIGNMANSLPTVDFNPVGNYLAYNPLDRNYNTNKLSAQAAATRRAIGASASPSRNAALLAADYNNMIATGNLARQAEEFNLNQRQQVEGFNRATNMFNTEGAMKAAQINQGYNEMRLRGALAKADLMEKQNILSSQGKSANLTNFFDNVGEIGRENATMNMVRTNPALYYTYDKNKGIVYKDAFYNLDKQSQQEVARYASANQRGCGGKLMTKRK